MLGEQEVKAVYDVKLLKDKTETNPDGTIKVKVPLPQGIKNPKVLVKKSNGGYEEVDAKIENGYLVYETDELGKVSIIGDAETESSNPSNQETEQEPTKTDLLQTTVKGSYRPGENEGGANTDDISNVYLYGSLASTMMGFLWIIIYKRFKRIDSNH